MSSDQLELLLGQLRSEGQLESEGGFTLDKKVSRKKWQEISWDDTVPAILYILQLGYLWESSTIKIEISDSIFLGTYSKLRASWVLPPSSPFHEQEYLSSILDDPSQIEENEAAHLLVLLVYGLLNSEGDNKEVRFPQQGVGISKSGEKDAQLLPPLTPKKDRQTTEFTLEAKIKTHYSGEAHLNHALNSNLPWLAFLHPSQIFFQDKLVSRLPEDLYSGPIDNDYNIGWLFFGFEPDHQTKEYPLDILIPQLNDKQSYHDEEQLILHNGHLNRVTPWIIDPWLHPIDPSKPKAQITSHHQGVVLGTGAIDKDSELLLVRNGTTLSRHKIADGTKGLLYFLPINEGQTDFSGLKLVQDESFTTKVASIFEMLGHADQTITSNLHRMPVRTTAPQLDWALFSSVRVAYKYYQARNTPPIERYLHQRFFEQSSPEDCLAMAIAAITPSNPDFIEVQQDLLEPIGLGNGISLHWGFKEPTLPLKIEQLNHHLKHFSEKPQSLVEKLAFSILAHHSINSNLIDTLINNLSKTSLTGVPKIVFAQKHKQDQSLSCFLYDSDSKKFSLKAQDHNSPLLLRLARNPLDRRRSLFFPDPSFQSGFLLYIPMQGFSQTERSLRRLQRLLAFHPKTPVYDAVPLWTVPRYKRISFPSPNSKLTAHIPLPILAYASSYESSAIEQTPPINLPQSAPSLTKIQMRLSNDKLYQKLDTGLFLRRHYITIPSFPRVANLQAHGLGAQGAQSYLDGPVRNCRRYYIQTCSFERIFTAFLYSRGVCLLAWNPPIFAPGLQAILTLEDEMVFRGGPGISWLKLETKKLEQEVAELRQLLKEHLPTFKSIQLPAKDPHSSRNNPVVSREHYQLWLKESLQLNE